MLGSLNLDCQRLGRFGGISRGTLILFSDVCYIFFNL